MSQVIISNGKVSTAGDLEISSTAADGDILLKVLESASLQLQGDVLIYGDDHIINGSLFVSNGLTVSGPISLYGGINFLNGNFYAFYSNSISNTLELGRNASEKFSIFVNDNDVVLTATQDVDENTAHKFILDRVFGGTGSNDFFIRKDGVTQVSVNSFGNVGLGGVTSARSSLEVFNKKTGADLIIEGTTLYQRNYALVLSSDPSLSDSRPGILQLGMRTAGSGIAYTMQAAYIGFAEANLIHAGSFGVYGSVQNPTSTVEYMYFGATSGNAYNSTTLKLDRDGNVGVGVPGASRPSSKFHLVGNALIDTGELSITSTSSNPTISLTDTTAGNDPFIRFVPATAANSFAIGIDDSDADKFKISYGANAVLGTNDRFVIDIDGNTGIGFAAPISALDVRGLTILHNSAGTSYNENLRLPEAASGYASIHMGGSAGISGTATNQ
jgi:hypothetical protein